MQAQATGTPIISCMGAGNKLDASALEVADIYDTSVCPLARVMRAELRKRVTVPKHSACRSLKKLLTPHSYLLTKKLSFFSTPSY